MVQMTAWDVAAACNLYLDGGAPPPVVQQPSKISTSAITRLYEKYKDKHEDLIMAAGVEAFCKDLRVCHNSLSCLDLM